MYKCNLCKEINDGAQHKLITKKRNKVYPETERQVEIKKGRKLIPALVYSFGWEIAEEIKVCGNCKNGEVK